MHNLEPFVPSGVCLSCDGCCRFKEPESVWRPFMAAEERAAARALPLFDRVTAKTPAGDGRLPTRACGAEHGCAFFNFSDHTCGIYPARPFECRLYPFILSRHGGGIKLFVHLSCPFIQEKRYTPEFDRYVEYLRDFLNGPAAAGFLRANPGAAGDYRDYRDELEYLFTVTPERRVGEGVTATELRQQTGDLPALRDLFERYSRRGRPELAVQSFVQVAAWRDHFTFRFEEVGGCLCVFARHEAGEFLYLPPLGEPDENVLKTCFVRMREANGPGGVSRVENAGARFVQRFAGRYSSSLKGYEYVYFRQDLAALKGNAYKSKRHAYNACRRRYGPEYLPYSDDMAQECARLFDAWAAGRRTKGRDEMYRYMLAENRGVHRLLIAHWRTLGLTGRVARVNGRIRAYTFGYPLTRDMFCVALEVADTAVTGLPVFIFREFCDDPEVRPYPFINAMDDSFLDNLQNVKTSFRPSVLLPAFVLTQS